MLSIGKLARGFAAAALILFAASAASAQTPPSYRLNCMGGPSMRIATNHDVPSPGSVGAIAMRIYFTAAPSAARPGAGQCTWVDRTFRPGEPQQLYLRSDRIEFAFQVMGDGTVVRDGSGPRLDAEGMTPEAANWSRVVDAVLNGAPFSVMVYNDGGSVMRVTAILP